MAEFGSSEPPPSAAADSAIDRLDNSDVRWDGTLAGIVPTIVGAPARHLLASGDAVIPKLVSALEDESKFVVAHVLLTLMSGLEYHTMPWNGLKIDLSPDGEAVFDVGQRFDLTRRWRAWQRAARRSQSLPD